MYWQQIFESISDPDRGRVGIEVELFIRRDAYDAFFDLLNRYQFDNSFEGIADKGNSLEKFYRAFEFKNDPPSKLSNLLPRLSAVLSWLKKKDIVRLSSIERNPHPYSADKIDSLGKHRRLAKMPRGLMPQGMGAGIHIHLDVHEWFDSADHLHRFYEFFSSSADELKAQVVPQRYNTANRGSFWASFPNYSLAKPNPSETPGAWASRVKSVDRYKAINLGQVGRRGDIEIRIFHASLNIETITHWFNLVLEIVEATRKDEVIDWRDFLDQLDDPTVDTLDKRQKHYAKSKWDPDNTKPASRRVNRILGLKPAKMVGFEPCANCGRSESEHSNTGLRCPIFDEDGYRTGYSQSANQVYEPS